MLTTWKTDAAGHVGDDMQEVDQGTLIFPGAAHAIKNAGDEPLVFVSAMSPPFDPAELTSYFAYPELSPSSAATC